MSWNSLSYTESAFLVEIGARRINRDRNKLPWSLAAPTTIARQFWISDDILRIIGFWGRRASRLRKDVPVYRRLNIVRNIDAYG